LENAVKTIKKKKKKKTKTGKFNFGEIPRTIERKEKKNVNGFTTFHKHRAHNVYVRITRINGSSVTHAAVHACATGKRDDHNNNNNNNRFTDTAILIRRLSPE